MCGGKLGIGAETAQPGYGGAGRAEEGGFPSREVHALKEPPELSIGGRVRIADTHEEEIGGEDFGYFKGGGSCDRYRSAELLKALRDGARLLLYLGLAVLEEDECPNPMLHHE